MKTSRTKIICNAQTIIPERNKEIQFNKKNLQLIRQREVEALAEFTRQKSIDRYFDLEN